MAYAVGIPKEHRPFEYRVGLTPNGVSLLTAQGLKCYVETGAGIGSGFTDAEYQKAGAQIAYEKDEVFRRADLILKILRPTEEEVRWMKGDQVIMAFMMLASAVESRTRLLTEKNITPVAYELIQEEDGRLPVLFPLSQIGGRMIAQIAAQYLQNNRGGNGILLGGIAGVPPAEAVIIGAGVVGVNAARAFIQMGSRVILLDYDLRKLQNVHHQYPVGPITTMIAHEINLHRVCTFADVLVGAVQVTGQRAPQIITREMVQSMRPGSLIIDMSIDQGGSIETSRPTHHDKPVFMFEGINHYCVPNVPGVVGRTATNAFVNAAWPYIQLVATEGIVNALAQSPELRGSVAIPSEAQMATP